METGLLIHSPTLESVLMVEETIRKYSGELGRYQLWRRLPRKMMYQTFQTIINYLEYSNKILIDKQGKIVWIWNPRLIARLVKQGLVK